MTFENVDFVTFTKIVERADLNNNIPEMDKKLTKEETLAMIDQQIQKEMTRSGRTYKEVSEELMAKMKAKLEKSKGVTVLETPTNGGIQKAREAQGNGKNRTPSFN